MAERPGVAASSALNRELVARLRTRLPTEYPLHDAEPGQWLIHVGEPLTRLPLIESGGVEAVIHVGDQGNLVIPVSYGPGELALSSTLFSEPRADVDLIVESALRMRWLPLADVEACLLHDHTLLVLLVRFLSQRLREVQGRERNWLERGIHERVCAVLTRLAAETPQQPDGRLLVFMTHEHLAARCGFSRPKLSNELKRLEEAGTLKLHRGAIEVIKRGDLDRPR